MAVRHAWQGRHVWWGDMHGREHAWKGACMAGGTAIAAGGTHPTGMHSCYYFILEQFAELSFAH